VGLEGDGDGGWGGTMRGRLGETEKRTSSVQMG
jgi:hypothetical protein